MPREMVVPDGKPAFEWILGRPVQKVSPKRRHSLLQAEFVVRLRGHTHFDESDRFAHPALPGLTFVAASVFAVLHRPG